MKKQSIRKYEVFYSNQGTPKAIDTIKMSNLNDSNIQL